MTPQTWTTASLIVVLMVYEIVSSRSDKKRFESLSRAKQACENRSVKTQLKS